jgi:hypothetical protein
MSQMDVDPIKRAASPLASSSAKRTKTLLSDAQVATLVNNMKNQSDLYRWLETVDKDQWKLSQYVLMHLTSELASTNMGGTVIPSPNFQSALTLLKTFTQTELSQWENGIRNGIDNNDWNDLIMHRKYTCFRFLDIALNYTRSETANSNDAGCTDGAH